MSDPERGAILIMTMILMSATVLLGLAYLSSATLEAEATELSWPRTRAIGLAEAGVEHALAELREYSEDGDPLPGTPTTVTLGDDSYTFEISASADPLPVYSIASAGTVEGVTMGFRSTVATITSGLDIDCAFGAGGSVLGTGLSTLSWSGWWAASGAGAGPAARRRTIGSLLFELTGADPHARDSLDTYGVTGPLAGHYQLGDPEDIYLTEPLTLEGSFFVSGDFLLSGDNTHAITLTASDDTPVLLVDGNLTIRDTPSFTLKGSIIVTGDVTIHNVSNILAHGSLVSGEDITLTSVSGSWDYDPAVLAHPPTIVVPAAPTPRFEETERGGETPSP